jgi:hypothetical protein
MWAGMARTLSFKPTQGVAVRVHGRPNVYAQSGRFQIVVSRLLEDGEGELQRKFLELRDRLQREGFFAPERKRPLPFLPRAVGLVTSKTGAVLHDMMVKIRERFPSMIVYLSETRVQGEGAAREIAAAIHFPTLVLLFALMILSDRFAAAGVYARLAARVAAAAGSPTRLLILTTMVAGGLSAVLVNDIVVFVMAPLLVGGLRARGLDPRPFLAALAGAAKGASVLHAANAANTIIASPVTRVLLPPPMQIGLTSATLTFMAFSTSALFISFIFWPKAFKAAIIGRASNIFFMVKKVYFLSKSRISPRSISSFEGAGVAAGAASSFAFAAFIPACSNWLGSIDSEMRPAGNAYGNTLVLPYASRI